MKKVIFFDLDNTIFSTKQQRILPNTLKMLEELASDENVILGLATGRAPHKILMLGNVIDYFDFIVYVNGALVYQKDKIIYKQAFVKEQIKEILDYAKEIDVIIGLVGHRDEYITKYNDQVKGSLKGFNDHVPKNVDENAFNDDIYQLWIFNDNIESLKMIKEKYRNLNLYPWHSGGADLTLPNINKANGIKYALKNLTNYQLITVGDGFNDINMIKMANISVAMENSGFLELKSAATYIAPHIEDDLLYEFMVDKKII